GNEAEAEKRIAVLASVPSIEFSTQADVLAQRIAREAGLSGQASEDALHIAVAATHGIDYLVTWNCKHLANPRILPKVARTCARAGYRSPSICTPEAILRRVVYVPPAYTRNLQRDIY